MFDKWFFQLFHQIIKNSSRNKATILTFHRVIDNQNKLLHEHLGVDEFVTKVTFLKKYFNVISLAELIDLQSHNEIPPLSVVLTFDDGYSDSYTTITPILDDLNINGTFFIATEGIEKGRLWNDRIAHALEQAKVPVINKFYDLPPLNLSSSECLTQAYKVIHGKCKYLTLAEREIFIEELENMLIDEYYDNIFVTSDNIVEMYNAGMVIGAHTHKHPILALESDDVALAEIRTSKQKLEQIIDVPIEYFAFPNGKANVDFLPIHQKMVQDIGFTVALSTDIGVITPSTDLYNMPRYTPWDRKAALFGLRLCNHFKKY